MLPKTCLFIVLWKPIDQYWCEILGLDTVRVMGLSWYPARRVVTWIDVEFQPRSSSNYAVFDAPRSKALDLFRARNFDLIWDYLINVLWLKAWSLITWYELNILTSFEVILCAFLSSQVEASRLRISLKFWPYSRSCCLSFRDSKV